MMPSLIDLGANALVLPVAAWIDVRTRRIPNWLSLPFALCGILFRLLTGGGKEVLVGVEGLGLALLLFGWVWLLKGMGMGDLKLAAGVGAWIGPSQFMIAFVMTGIAGGVMAVAYAFRRGSLAESFENTADLLAHFGRGRLSAHSKIQLGGSKALAIPYAPAIAFGTLFSFLTR